MSKKVITWFLCLALSTGLLGGNLAAAVPTRSEGEEVVQEIAGTEEQDNETQETGGTEENDNETQETGGTEENDNETQETDGTEENDNETQPTKVSFVEETVGGKIITVKGASNAFPEGTVFNVTSVGKEELTVPEGKKLFVAFDITAKEGDTAVQPSSPVEIEVKGLEDEEEEPTASYINGTKTETMEVGRREDKTFYFVAPHFSTYAIFVAGEEVTIPSEDVLDGEELVEKVTVKATAGGKEIKDGMEISLADGLTFEARYDLKSPLWMGPKADWGLVPTGEKILTSGKYYKLPSLESEFLEFDTSFDIPIDTENGEHLGKAVVSSDGTVLMHVTYPEKDRLEDFKNVYFKLSVTLNEAKIGTRESITIKLPGGATCELKIKENKPKEPQEPTVTKEAAVEGETIHWTVTVTNDALPVEHEEGITVCDTIMGDQDYVDFTFAVDGEVKNPRDQKKTDKGCTLYYDITSMTEGESWEITYDTKVKLITKEEDFQTEGKLEKTVSNAVELTDRKTGNVITDKPVVKEVTVTKDISSWVTKDGGTLNADGTANWKVTIRNNGYPVKDVTIHDLFEGDKFTTDHMKLLPDTVHVKKNDSNMTQKVGDEELDEGEYRLSTTPTATETWSVNVGKLAGVDTVELTYTTQLESYAEFLRLNHNSKPSNKAWMTFQFDFKGDGTGYTPVKGPEMSRESDIKLNAGIDKSCVRFDRADHTILWKIVANKNEQELHNTTITDKIPKGQTFVGIYSEEDVPAGKTLADISGRVKLFQTEGENRSSEEVAIEDSAISTEDAGDGKSNVKIEFHDEVERKCVEFYIKTKLTDAEASTWSANAKKVYSNEAELNCDEQTGVKDAANCTYTSEVIRKTATTFQHDTHKIPYTIVINQNNMDMDEVKVTDALKEAGMTLDEDSVKLDGTPFTGFTVDAEGNAVFSIGNISRRTTLTFLAKVNDREEFKKARTSVSVTNTASITTKVTQEQNVTANLSSTKTIQFISESLKKEYKALDGGKLLYSVEVNRALQELPNVLMVWDNPADGIDIDANTVSVKKATVGADGKVTAGSETVDVTVTKDKNTGKITILFPEMINNRNCYLMTYEAKVIPEAASYKNSVAMEGVEEVEGASSVAVKKQDAEALAKKGSHFYFFSKVTDEKDGKPVPGVVLEIDEKDGEEVAVITTKADGEAKIIDKLDPGEKYTIKVKDVPDGYCKPEKSKDFEMGKAPGRPGTRQDLVIASKSEKIKFLKTDMDGKALEGAKLTLSRLVPGESPVKIDEFVSKKEAVEQSVYYDELYTLSETEEPFGYEKAEDIIFKLVEEAGAPVIKVKQPDDTFATQNGPLQIVMKDKKLGTGHLTIRKITKDQENPVEGATIRITENGKTKVLEEIVTDGKTYSYDVELPANKTYELKETAYPKGFKEQKVVIGFRFDDEQKLQVLDGAKGEYEIADSNTVIIKNEIAPDTFADNITFKEKEETEDGEELTGGKFTIYPVTKAEDPEAVKQWTETAEVTKLDLNYQRWYKVVEEEAPEGYIPSEEKIIKVSNDGTVMVLQEDGSFLASPEKGVVIMVDRKKPKAGTGGTTTPGGTTSGDGTTPGGTTPDDGATPGGTTPDDGATPGETTPEDGATPGGTTPDDGATPGGTTPDDGATPGGTTPEESKPSPGGHTGNSDEDDTEDSTPDTDKKPSGKPDQNGKKTGGSKEDENPQDHNPSVRPGHSDKNPDKKRRTGSDPAPRLAQTGGFMGTMMSYGLGIIFILLGCLLKFFEMEKKKCRK